MKYIFYTLLTILFFILLLWLLSFLSIFNPYVYEIKNFNIVNNSWNEVVLLAERNDWELEKYILLPENEILLTIDEREKNFINNFSINDNYKYKDYFKELIDEKKTSSDNFEIKDYWIYFDWKKWFAPFYYNDIYEFHSYWISIE